MLFNSLVFILGFLPVAVIGYYALAATRLTVLRLHFLVLMSLIFYGYWTPQYTVLLAVSVIGNYGLGLMISAERTGAGVRRALVILGVLLNLGALGYFKYANFFMDNLSLLFGAGFAIEKIVLPLAISFYTFQQVAFLVDLGRGHIRLGGPVSYAAFVIFFPQLIAGPIVQFQELVPQLVARPRLRRALENILIGLTIFGLGLFKKTVLADTAALYASPVFDAARDGDAPGLAASWGAAFAYTLQVYFDFAGYSDMAIGLSRLFGVKLPLNFHSPLRSRSINDLWRRWHMTLGRFVRTYVFSPLSLPLARWSAGRGHGRWKGQFVSVLLPLFISMVIIGVWHGAGWTFFLFGAMHGGYMVINEAWTFARRRRKGQGRPPEWLAALFTGWRARALTLVAFVVAVVPFRAEGMAAVGRIFAGMIGLNGPSGFAAAWPLGVGGLLAILAIGYLIVLLAPNTQQIMARTGPALDWPQWREVGLPVVSFSWRPTPLWCFVGGVAFLLGLAFILRGTTEFIYFNF